MNLFKHTYDLMINRSNITLLFICVFNIYGFVIQLYMNIKTDWYILYLQLIKVYVVLYFTDINIAIQSKIETRVWLPK